MPRPVKTDRPVIAEPVVEAIQGTTIVVIHPGSSNLHIGRATDHFAQSIPHVIATRIDENFQQKRATTLYRKGIFHDESDAKQHHGLQQARTLLHSMRVKGSYKKPKVSADEVAAYNEKVEPEESSLHDTKTSYTDTSDGQLFYIGDQALNIDPKEKFMFTYPFAHGKLNLHSGIHGSITALAANIELLWGKAIESFLDIPIKDFQFYRAVLIIPDIFDRDQAKLLVDIVLNRMKFSCIIVAQESVCGTFGSGLLSACLIDVGSHKTSICCIEDGLSIPSTRVTLKYGGNDISRLFLTLLQMSSFPYRDFDVMSKLDVLLLQELKETFCHLSLDIPSGHVHEFQVVQPDKKARLYKIKLGDEPLLAPIALFVPDLFGLIDEELIETFPEHLPHDTEDLMDDRYLLERRDLDTKKTKGETDNDSQSQENPQLSSQNNILKEHAKIEPLRHDGMPLDEAVMYSIEQCNNQETKRKMYSTILLIGGGMNFKGVDEFLLKRLQMSLPTHYQFMKEQMDVITRPKESDPRTTAWKGGSVMSILDSAQELWILRKEWNQYGVRILRERCGFQWSTNMDKQ